MKQKAEEADKVAGNIKKTLEELWKVTKTNHEDSITAYSGQLETDARNAAIYFAELAAAAANAR